MYISNGTNLYMFTWKFSCMSVCVCVCVCVCVMWDKGLTYLVCASLTQVGYTVQAHRNKVVFAMHMGLLGTRNSPLKVPHHKGLPRIHHLVSVNSLPTCTESIIEVTWSPNGISVSKQVE